MKNIDFIHDGKGATPRDVHTASAARAEGRSSGNKGRNKSAKAKTTGPKDRVFSFGDGTTLHYQVAIGIDEVPVIWKRRIGDGTVDKVESIKSTVRRSAGLSARGRRDDG